MFLVFSYHYFFLFFIDCWPLTDDYWLLTIDFFYFLSTINPKKQQSVTFFNKIIFPPFPKTKKQNAWKPHSTRLLKHFKKNEIKKDRTLIYPVGYFNEYWVHSDKSFFLPQRLKVSKFRKKTNLLYNASRILMS